jgi:MAF protein
MASMAGRSPQLVLASASPRRRDLLDAVGLDFRVTPAGLDEEAIAAGLGPETAACAVAAAKAGAIDADAAVVLAADTIVVLDDRMLGKPASPDEASRMLEALRDRTHRVVTGVVVRAGGVAASAVAWSAVRMRAYHDDEIAAYVAGGGGCDKAGAYGIQDEPFRPVAAIDGCWCNVMGLPLWTALGLLDHAGCRAPRRPDHAFARCASCPLLRTVVPA